MFYFFIFSFILALCSVQVIFSRNPVYSVLFLVLAFCNSSVLLLMLEVEFLGLLFLVVYVGAIAVLFLFVVMILDIKEVAPLLGFQSTGEIYRYLPVSFVLGGILFCVLFFVFSGGFVNSPDFFNLYYVNFFYSIDFVTNIEIFGNVLYTYFFFYLIVAGLLLLLAMVGCVYITIDRKVAWSVQGSKDFDSKVSRRQSVYQQLSRTRKNAVFLVKLDFSFMDFFFSSINKFFRVGMRSGLLNKKRQILFDSFFLLKYQYGVESPLLLAVFAFANVKPLVELRKNKGRYQSGANLFYISKESRRVSIGMRWIFQEVRKNRKKGQASSEVLARELFLASQCQGLAYSRKKRLHQVFCINS